MLGLEGLRIFIFLNPAFKGSTIRLEKYIYEKDNQLQMITS